MVDLGAGHQAGDESGADGLGLLAERGGDNAEGFALGGPEVFEGGALDAAEVAVAEGFGGGIGVDQATADDKAGGIDGHGKLADEEAHGFGLEVEELEGEGVAFLSEAAKFEDAFLFSKGWIFKRVAGVAGEGEVEEIGEAGEGGVHFKAAPFSAAAAGENWCV